MDVYVNIIYRVSPETKSYEKSNVKIINHHRVAKWELNYVYNSELA